MAFLHLTKDGRVRIVGHSHVVSNLKSLDLAKVMMPHESEDSPKITNSSDGEEIDLRGISVEIKEENISKSSTLRRIISQLIIQKGKGSRSIWGNVSHRPPYWPDEVPFVSPSTSNADSSGRVLKNHDLRTIITSWKTYTIKMLQSGVSYKNAADSNEVLKSYSHDPAQDTVGPGYNEETDAAVDLVVTRNLNNSTFSYNGITISPADVERVRQNQYIDDNVVNGYITYQLENAESRGRFKLLDSNFAQVLLACSNDGSFDRVNSWYADNLFLYEMIFLPICDSSHWTLVAFHVPAREIYVLCSVGGNYPRTANIFKRFIEDRAIFNKVDGIVDRVRVIHPKVPKQQNGVDCGVFVCFYAKALIEMKDRNTINWEGLISASGTTKVGRTKLLATLENVMCRRDFTVRLVVESTVRNHGEYIFSVKLSAYTGTRILQNVTNPTSRVTLCHFYNIYYI